MSEQPVTGSSTRAEDAWPPCGIIALTTDFGLADGYVGQMRAVMAGIDRTLTVIDITHQVPPGHIATGGFLAAAAVAALPPGAVLVVVIDPGVGTARHGLLARVGPVWFVGPDNGAWTYLAARAEAAGQPVHVWRLSDPAYWRPVVSATFHGRDVFAPVAAHLARGVPPERLGQPLAAPVRLPLPAVDRGARQCVGRIIHVDRFGNAITDITPDHLAGLVVRSVTCGAFRAPCLVTTYAAAAPGAPAALFGSFGTLELARRDGDAAATWGMRVGAVVTVEGD